MFPENDQTGGAICIGSLNLDRVVRATVPPDVVAELSVMGGYRQYGEMSVSDAQMTRLVRVVDAMSESVKPQLGGSAFNVIRALRGIDEHMRIAYVGAVQDSASADSHLAYFKSARVDVAKALLAYTPCAQTLSFAADGDRTLITSIGAGKLVPEYFENSRRELSRYISSFDVVHLTSLHTDVSVAELSDVVHDALDWNPNLVVSIEPGDFWTRRPSKALLDLVSSASLVSGPAEELGRLGGRIGNEPLTSVAVRISELMRRDRDRLVVVRARESVRVLTAFRGGHFDETDIPMSRLPPNEVTDATGAGDTFTAGLLAVLLLPSKALLGGVVLGEALAKARIRKGAPLSAAETRAAFDSVVSHRPSVGM